MKSASLATMSTPLVKLMQFDEFEFRRLSELQAISVRVNSPEAFFQLNDTKFSDPLKLRYFRRIEDDLRGLDADAWDALKSAAARRLIRTKDRGWQPLFDTLNEAKAYNHLVAIGCTSVKFIPQSKTKRQRTPDLQALSDSVVTFCEVKTINVSDKEAERLRNGGVGTTLLTVEDGLLSKITSVLQNANDQMYKFYPLNDARRIVYVVVNFDNNFDMALEYQSQVRSHVDDVKPLGVEAVLFFKPPFER
jgi:hypothetical protein